MQAVAFHISKKTAEFKVKSVASVNLESLSEMPIDTHYVDYKTRIIKLFGTFNLSVSSFGLEYSIRQFFYFAKQNEKSTGLTNTNYFGNANHPIKILFFEKFKTRTEPF